MPKQVRPVGIVGVGSAVPDRILTNADLERMVDTNDDWIITRTGIRERRITTSEETTSTIAVRAARRALDDAGISPEEVDLILIATVTPDMVFPSTACLVQDAIGATRAAAMDLSAACPGFIYGISIGSQTIASGMYDTVLVIGAETLTKITDFQDRNTAVLFGDAAGAVVLRPVSEGKGILSSVLGSEGSGAELLKLPAGGSRNPATFETVEKRQHYISMNGNEVFKFAVRIMGEASLQALEKAGLSREDVDLLIPHQANTRIIDSAVKRLKLDPDKVIINVERFGNTSSASIPVAMDEALRAGRIKDGDTLVLVSFGAGLVWGACVVRWGR